ncbi:hypothetical protein K5D68_18275 [Pseudomonas cichorii]|nr:hypothetical protein [Pseudomonas cichorii]MBX8585985.1 hypothetical protein [Pseudomonas cichorii]
MAATSFRQNMSGNGAFPGCHVAGDYIRKHSDVPELANIYPVVRNEPFLDPLFSPQIRPLKINDLQSSIKKGVKRLLAHIFL